MDQSHSLNPLTVTAIPAFNDNYIWAIGRENQAEITLVDPGDANVCIDYIDKHHKKLTHILITHHHKDHVGGVESLQHYCNKNAQAVIVYGPENDPVICDKKLNSSQQVFLSDLELTLDVIDLPGHTLGHIAYYGNDMLFCGDTLFSGGCGRIFEGSAEQMFTSINKLKHLPEKTHIYCAHEYTLNNLKFALSVEPRNGELIFFYNNTLKQRKKGLNTIPSSIFQEKRINPFLRCDQKDIHKSVSEYCNKELINELDVFTHLRAWKDNA